MTAQTTEVSTEENASTDSAPPPHHGLRTHKAPMLPDASEYLQEKKPSKVLAAQTKLENKLKEMMMMNIESLTVYERKFKTMVFESTPIPPPPPGTTLRAKIPASVAVGQSGSVTVLGPQLIAQSVWSS